MVASTHADQLNALTALALANRCAEIHYRSRLAPERTRARIVEPYALTQGREDAMVRCYQIAPDEGWRFFMLHKIDSVHDTGLSFQPRQPITLAIDAAATFGTPALREPWTEAMRRYRDLVSDAIADGIISRRTFEQIREYAEAVELSEEQVRYVHASLFYRCLGAILRDGTVGAPQLAELRLVQRVLTGLGWGVTGAVR
jgi:hypothetical protein